MSVTGITEYTIDTDTGEVIADELFNNLDLLGLKQSFVIDNLQRCEWYIDKINSVNHKREQLTKNYKAMQADLDREEKALQYLFENQFITEIKKHIPDGKKSIKTLSGQVQFRACKANIEINEREALASKYITQEEIIKIVEKIDKEAIIADFEAGLSPDGVKYIPARDNMTIK